MAQYKFSVDENKFYYNKCHSKLNLCYTLHPNLQKGCLKLISGFSLNLRSVCERFLVCEHKSIGGVKILRSIKFYYSISCSFEQKSKIREINKNSNKMLFTDG